MGEPEIPDDKDVSAPAAPARKRSLKDRAIRGAAWSFFGQFSGQAIRLGSNLILTRLLFPEAFGLMTLVNVFIIGLNMLSDLGLEPCVVQSRRGEEPTYLRTAWTIQILRGCVLFVCTVLIAWPVAALYDEPRLMMFLPVVGLTTIIAGFNSTVLFSLTRRLRVGTLTAIELGAQLVGVLTMIAGAIVWRSVWALVIGRLVASFVKMLLTHSIRYGPRMRFAFDRTMVNEILHFGKWIFLASLFTFLLAHMDRLVLGKFVTMAELGVYSIAFILSQVTVKGMRSVLGRVLFPIYARTVERGMTELRQQTIRARRALMLATMPPIWVLVVWGPEIIELLYDERYHEAGWMLQLLGIAAIFLTTLDPVGSVLLAVGDSFRHMLLQLTRSIILVTAMAVGGYWGGARGVILGFIVASFAHYPILVGLVRRYKVWLPALDFAGVALSALALGLGFWIKSWIVA